MAKIKGWRKLFDNRGVDNYHTIIIAWQPLNVDKDVTLQLKHNLNNNNYKLIYQYDDYERDLGYFMTQKEAYDEAVRIMKVNT